MDFYNKLSDADLSVLLKENDERAFTEIYERYHSLLYIYAQKKLHNKLEAQDIVQDVLVTLWNKRLDFSLKVSLASFLFTAVRNKALDVFAHRQVEEKYIVSLQGFIASNVSSDFLVRENDLKAMIEKEIQALPPRMREVFELSRKERLTNKEIAQLLDISQHTVDTQIKRALNVLRKRLGFFLWLIYVILN